MVSHALDTSLVGQASYGERCSVQARDLWFSYDGRFQTLRGVDLNLSQGAMTMVVGRSGSGKTTLLKVLKGLLAPQRGSVRFLLEACSNGDRPWDRVAYIPQTLGLVRNMTALENVLTGALGRSAMMRSLLRSFPRVTIAEARESLSRLGMHHKIDERVHNLSGGERQRVAIARALMQRPAVILADEFVSQLDPITSEETLSLMREVADDGVSLLITTHETDVVAHYADRVVVMREGRISHEGPAGSLSIREMVEMLR